MKTSFILVMVVAVVVAGYAASADGYDDAHAAYRRADYATTLKLVRPLAEKGDPRAQYLLSLMYGLGRGVKKDECTAAVWADKAARQGYSDAFHQMAWVHSSGFGVPVDNELAYRWALAAVNSGDAETRKNLQLFELGLSEAARKRIASTMGTWSPKDQEPLRIRRLPNNPYGWIMERITGIRRCNSDD